MKAASPRNLAVAGFGHGSPITRDAAKHFRDKWGKPGI
jgi:hypothetical protein